MKCYAGPLFVHLATAVAMLSFSAYYHLFMCENQERCVFLRCFDYAGIAGMICGSCTPAFYYGFMCDENRFWRYFYMGQVWIFCLAATYLTLRHRKDRSKKKQTAATFLLAGWSCGIGGLHLAYGTSETLLRTFPLWPYFIGGILYVFGALCYAFHVPERWFPESRFIATWAQSHSIFHWMVLWAALIMAWSSLRVFHERQIFPCPETGVFPTDFGRIGSEPGSVATNIDGPKIDL